VKLVRQNLIFALSLIFSLVILFKPGGEGALPFAYADKLLHLITFAILTLASGLRFGLSKITLGLIVAYALMSEIIQEGFIVNRGFELTDLLADSVGIALVKLGLRVKRGPIR
jgi:hypothetical protein